MTVTIGINISNSKSNNIQNISTSVNKGHMALKKIKPGSHEKQYFPFSTLINEKNEKLLLVQPVLGSMVQDPARQVAAPLKEAPSRSRQLEAAIIAWKLAFKKSYLHQCIIFGTKFASE